MANGWEQPGSKGHVQQAVRRHFRASLPQYDHISFSPLRPICLTSEGRRADWAAGGPRPPSGHPNQRRALQGTLMPPGCAFGCSEGGRDSRGAGPTQPAAEARARAGLHGRRSCSSGPSASSPTPFTRTAEQLSAAATRLPAGQATEQRGSPAAAGNLRSGCEFRAPDGPRTALSPRPPRFPGDARAPGGRARTRFERLRPPEPSASPPAPNGRCPCGSGKKYKRCCGR